MFLKSISSSNNQSATTAKTPVSSGKKIVPSVVSSDMNILGNIISEGTIDFDGIIDGNIRCGTLVLRQHGRVNGEVHAETVQIYGKVKGLIKAKAVHLYSACSVEGVIMHETIAIEDGATIDGKFKRTNKTGVATHAASHAPVLQSPILSDEPLPAAEEEEEGGAFEAPRILENIRLIAG